MSTTQESPIGQQRFDARKLKQKSVTVFTDGAEVRRMFDVKLEKGRTDVIVDNLAWEIDFGSVQFEVDHAATIEAIQFKEEHATWAEVDSPQVTEVVQQQQDLQRELASKKAQKTLFEKSLNKKMDKLLLDSELEMADKHSELDNNEGRILYYNTHLSDIQALILSTEAEIEELEAQNRKYEEQVQEMRPAEAKKKSIVVTLSSMAKAENKLALTYRVDNAYWSPCYVVHMTTERDKATPSETSDAVAPTKAHMKLHYMADIHQNTGETWDAENLVLSTAQIR
ncbi:Conserved hypothetical protein CHP02231 [Aphelenchoides avenae]|nr:Conserved hypothetical protein CHP02231 [Aphelenchus avenae]